MEKNIISCREYTSESEFDRDPMLEEAPVTLRNYNIDLLKGCTIVEWSCHLGSYGMGGPGFFGIRLSGDDFDAWLVLTLWSAGEWLLLDKQWIQANPNYYDKQKPLYTNFSGEEQCDAVTDTLVGCTLIDIVIEDTFSTLVLQKGKSGIHHLQIPQDTTVLPPYGSGKQRMWNTQESQKDAWVVTSKSLWVDDDEE